MDWIDIVGSLVGTVVATGLLALSLRQARRYPALREGVVVLRYPRVMRGFLAAGALLFAAASVVFLWPVVAGTATAQDTRRAMVAVPFLMLLAAWAWCEMRVRLEVDGDGIRGRTAFRGHRATTWKDLVEVRYSSGSNWFVLRDCHGEKLHVSRFLRGWEVVVAYLEAKVPVEAWRLAVNDARRH